MADKKIMTPEEKALLQARHRQEEAEARNRKKERDARTTCNENERNCKRGSES